MLRGLRWGELRASSGKIEPRLLVAPTTALRSQLKSLLLDGKWPGLLEACETAMGQPCGRGWLDLQRYAVEACSHLGRDYHAVDAALRAALRAFLSDVPEITSATMMDDTPAANLETLQWIAAEIQQDGEGAGRPQRRAAAPGSDGFRSEAMDLARAGRAEEAVEMLTRQVEQERSLRGRFRLRTQLAAILVEAGRDIIAQPILEELLAQIDNFRLEDWENGQIVAEPMALLYRVQTKLEYDFSMRQPLYLRICRLDPTQALRCPQ
jgi:type VI secretion system protein ImpA